MGRLLVGVIAVVGLAALVVGGILYFRDEDPPSDYDARTEDDFMATCTADADSLGFSRSDDFCQCAYDDITAEIDYDDYLEIDAALQDDPSAVPEAIDRIRTTCYVEVEAAGAPDLTTVPTTTEP
jgi:hypothetical protein